MIKLFLITLLCVAMFADSQEDQMNEMGTGLKKASADMAEHAMRQGSPLLMQYATADEEEGEGRGRRRGGSGGRGSGGRGREGNGRGGRGSGGRGRGGNGRGGRSGSEDN